MHSRRALLYVPGNDLRKTEKAVTLKADNICLDLEDGVAANRKAQARIAVRQSLQTLHFGNAERLARINSIGSGLELDDLSEVLLGKPDGIVIPKVAYPEQVRWVSRQVAAVESAHGWEIGSISLFAMIESARGVLNVAQIAGADTRLQALIFGAEDYAADVGAIRTRNGAEVHYARSVVVAAAAAYGLDAIDLVFLDFKDIDGLLTEARRGAELGYVGMQVIHPDQIAPVQGVFTPDDAAIARAQRILQASVEHQASGSGAFALDGKMIDMPIIKAAERVLSRARAAGKVTF